MGVSVTATWLAPTPALPQRGRELSRYIFHIDVPSTSSYPCTLTIQ